MASTAAGDDFDSWLIVKLKALNTDETVFSSYIKGILEGDEADDEKNESLDEILSEITDSTISSLRDEIVERWQSVFRLKEREEAEAAQGKVEDVDERLVRLMESQAKATIAVRNYSEEDRRLKEAILQQYGHIADQEEEGDEEEVSAASAGPVAASKNLEKNTNVDVVVQADKERREKARQDAINKKEKDKEDREKQKQVQQDKKEKRKTQKGERRR